MGACRRQGANCHHCRRLYGPCISVTAGSRLRRTSCQTAPPIFFHRNDKDLARALRNRHEHTKISSCVRKRHEQDHLREESRSKPSGKVYRPTPSFALAISSLNSIRLGFESWRFGWPVGLGFLTCATLAFVSAPCYQRHPGFCHEISGPAHKGSSADRISSTASGGAMFCG